MNRENGCEAGHTHAFRECSRRQGVVYTGQEFPSGGIIDDWSYNARNELTGTDRKTGTATSSIDLTDTFDTTNSTLDRRYTYDPIGNRKTARNSGTGSGTGQTTYRANALNQYDTNTLNNPVSGQGMIYEADGNLTGTERGHSEL